MYARRDISSVWNLRDLGISLEHRIFKINRLALEHRLQEKLSCRLHPDTREGVVVVDSLAVRADQIEDDGRKKARTIFPG